MSTNESDRRPVVTRRRVVQGTAWTVPTMIAATAVPVYAASPCATGNYTLDWGVSAWNRAADGRSGVATVTSTTQGAGPVTMTATTAYTGLMDVGSETKPNTNFDLEPAPIGGLQQQGLRLVQSIYTRRTVDGTRDSRGTYTFTFSVPVTNLSFTITDIDSNLYDYWDRVEIVGPGFTHTKPSSVVGAGTEANPWYLSSYSNPLPNESGAGNVRVTFTQPVTSFSIVYWNRQQSISNVDSDQSVYLGDFTFRAQAQNC